jgi:antitoxin component YwqK of YwqJK toxin-antitoxin module
MKTKITLFAFLLTGLIACSNQPTEKPVVDEKVEKYINPDSTNFTIVSQQDTTTQEGESITKYKNGKVKMQGMMKAGKRNGLWKSFYEDGTAWSETTFEAGIKNGKTITWFPNGKKRYEGFYTNDNESGNWTYWDEQGKEVSKKNYDVK